MVGEGEQETRIVFATYSHVLNTEILYPLENEGERLEREREYQKDNSTPGKIIRYLDAS